MKKSYDNLLCKLLLNAGMSVALILSGTAAVFGMEEDTEEQNTEVSTVNETEDQETPQEESDTSEEVLEKEDTEEQNTEVSTVNKTEDQETPQEESDTSEEILEKEDTEEQNTEVNTVNKTEDQETPQEEANTSEEVLAKNGITAEQEEMLKSVQKTDVSEEQETSETEEEKEVAVNETSGESNTAGMITIGDISFSPEDDESSQWADGKGWKNVPGQYVAMVDYDGSSAVIEADTDVLTLAVAGINRIGTLTGNCDVQIIGTGIVLIDQIDIAKENQLTLHPNTALYNEGSAAVFLKQEDGSYLLKNGGITGILDEDYTLENVRLRVPEGSSLTLSAMCIRTETWIPEGEEEAVSEYTIYTDSVPREALNPSHENGQVNVEDHAGRLVIGNNSSLTIDSGASVRSKEATSFTQGLPYKIKGSLVIQGTLEINGLAEGGFVDVKGGGSLLTAESAGSDGSVTASGTMHSVEAELQAGSSFSKYLLMDESTITVYENADSSRYISAMIKDSIIYLKGTDFIVSELDVSGRSMLSIETYEYSFVTCEIENIILHSEADLSILGNDHDMYYDMYNSGTWSGVPHRLLEDSSLEISGRISGSGTVSVLAGLVTYTGTETDILPAVPEGYAARVYVTGTDSMESTEYPLNMTATEAQHREESSEIPVSLCDVISALPSDEILARAWRLSSLSVQEPLVRDGTSYTCKSIMEAYGINTDNIDLDRPENGWPAVEVIYSNFTRDLIWIDSDREFTDEGVIMIRILFCRSQGGQGGSAVTSTSTSFTGSGSLGNPGSGTVQAGDGTVIYGRAEESESQETTVTEPEQADPQDNENDTGDTEDTNDTEDSANTETAVTDSGTVDDEWTDTSDTAGDAAYTEPVTPVYTAPQTAAVFYTVRFETNGGTAVASQQISTGTTSFRPADPVKEGYTFGGWYRDQELTEIFNFATPIRADTTAYAKWIEEEKPEEPVSEPEISEPEPEEKTADIPWLWIILAVLGAAGIGTGIVLGRKNQ